MKYGTICSTRKMPSHGLRFGAKRGCMFALEPRAKPRNVKIANVAGILDPLHEPAVGVRDRKEQQSAEQVAEDSTEGAAAREPVVHQDEPADADHRAEAEREVLDGGQAAVQPLALSHARPAL